MRLGIWVFTLGMVVTAATEGSAAPRVEQTEAARARAWVHEAASEPTPDIVIEREDLRILLGAAAARMGKNGEILMDRIREFRVTPGRPDGGGRRARARTEIFVTFDQAFTLRIARRQRVKSGQVYAVRVPQVLHLVIRADDGRLYLVAARSGREVRGLRFYAKVPLLPDEVTLRGVSLDLLTGRMLIFGGLGKWQAVQMAASAGFYSGQLEGVDFWASILRSVAGWFGRDGLRFSFR